MLKLFTLFIFLFSACGGAELVEETVEVPTTIKATTTSTTTTTLTTTTSTLPDIMPTVLINCEPVESFTMAEGYMNFNFEITTGTNELVVLNIVSWFDSSRTDDLFIYDGLPSPGSSNEFGYRVDASFSQYEIEIVVMDSKDNFANDYCLYEQNPDESNPSTTTTATTTPTTTTTTVDSIIKDSSLLNFSDIMNEFPEIPYCKYQYDEVAQEINKHFQNQDIRLTIREMLVETDNTDCHGLVSGSNFSFKNTVQDGDFVEITVESTKTLRIFPTYIANSPNAKGNNERWNLYCDLTGDGYLERDWMGEFSGNASDVYFYYGLYTNLNDPNTNCVA